MRALVLLAALLAVACGPARVDLPGSASVDPAFSESQTAAILDAFEAWRAATGGVAALSASVGTGGELHVRPSRMDGLTLGLTTLHPDGTADVEIDLRTVWGAARLERHTEDEELRDCAMHELGHAFGLEHTPGGLMAADVYGGGAVDPGTLRRFCENYGCP